MKLGASLESQLKTIDARHSQIQTASTFIRLSTMRVNLESKYQCECASYVYQIEEQDSTFKFNLLDNTSCSRLGSDDCESEASDCACDAFAFVGLNHFILQ
ncbi:Hypothetical_protein [Hexamita inflata]|uniref:Hypothetical_protein n=1 Tax=Hexamita inflata TaxID=28002 RepID=A0AA86QSD8_9EUKA|nr:Hypothetical protein HINF_LOCUS51395 [Hexamita inflata]